MFSLLYVSCPITYWMSRMSVAEYRENLQASALFISNHVSMGDHALILRRASYSPAASPCDAMEGELLRMWLHPPTGTESATPRLRCAVHLVNLFFHVFPLPKKSGFGVAFHLRRRVHRSR